LNQERSLESWYEAESFGQLTFPIVERGLKYGIGQSNLVQLDSFWTVIGHKLDCVLDGNQFCL